MYEKVIMVHAFPDANEHSAFIMDIILIYNKELETLLRGLPSFQYFKDRDLILRENKHFLKVTTVHVIPGKTYEPIHINVSNKDKLINCIVFCQFSKISENTVIPRKLIIGNLPLANIHLDVKGISLIEKEEEIGL